MIRKLLLFVAMLLLVPSLAMAETTQVALPEAKVHHYLLQKGPADTVDVDEVLQWNITGDTPGETIAVRIPGGAAEVRIQGGSPLQDLAGDQLEWDGDKVITPFKWTKGNNEVRINYKLPVTDGKAQLNTQLLYSNEIVYVLAPATDLSISSKQLGDMGVQNMQSKEYKVFGGQDIPAGIGLQFDISVGTSASGGEGVVRKSSPAGKIDFHSPEHLGRWYNSPLRDTDPHLWLAFLGVLIVGFITAISLYVRNKMKAAQAKDEEQKLDKLFISLQARHKKLINSLAKVEEELQNDPQNEELLKKKTTTWELLRDVKMKLKAVEEELDNQY